MTITAGNLKKACTAVIAVVCLGVLAGEASAQDRPVRTYGHENDGAALLDAINRDYGRPSPRPPVAVQRPWGVEIDPYNPRKFRYDTPGMIDAINRDYPTARRPR